ncbi:hypothetical protein AX774_g1318 [Zancudomyces culisetae]|uniref:Uncharacterized protein n=1 Tax=Zancudomyces culisetae TaxID=1213189 RepID=A0A1R1PW46_ZANCU|nr:hypothetical protein AX774_g1318 [Zancudomyces culisetae]|eukprot:OMH85133.1 hypothetical protein AX774_g1318 [Zancudomyces culisetae]
MFAATTALLSFPLTISHSPSSPLITTTKNRRSCSSPIAPLIDPNAQHSLFKLFQLHSVESNCFASFSIIIRSMSSESKCVNNTKHSRCALYTLIVSVSLINSRTISPSSFSTTNTSDGFAILSITTCRISVNIPS